MSHIHLLAQDTIDKIAAGEVIERPASIVKELVENAIDAGAGAVTIEIKGGGIELIRITDNGEGIEPDQIRNAFLRHATSKISRVEDLENIQSLGFRGEALASISAVSQVELITKRSDALTGIRYRIEGGREISMEEVGAPEGSTFLIRNVFYNVPARKKFLKSQVSEAGMISDLTAHIALSHPEISFKLISDNKVRLHTAGNNRLLDVIYSIYGREIASGVIPVEKTEDTLRLYGYIGSPSLSRGNRNYENYYVNGRYVRDKLLSGAIEEGYAGFLMQHRYPFTVLFLETAGSLVDVNVHPAKLQVRFARQETVRNLVQESIKGALTHKEIIPEATLIPDQELKQRAKDEQAERMEEAKTSPEPFEKIRRSFFARHDSPYEPKYPQHTAGIRETASSYTAGRDHGAAPAAGTEKMDPAPREDTDRQARQMQLFDDRLLSRENVPEHRIIGQVFDTFWLIEFRDELYIIDQHAAHEKVIYETLCRQMQQKEATSQQVSPPLMISLTPVEEEQLTAYMPAFEQIGFEISPFGGREYAISAVPANLYGFSDTLLFTQMLDTLSDHPDGAPEKFLYEKLAQMACKAAVKGHHRLSDAEARELIGQLLTLEDPYHCPHGRPTIISMSRNEMDRKFKRII